MDNFVKKYIVGVSGGPDSMCLLNKYKDKVVAVCHVNYQMRDSAKRDELIVKQFCLDHNIPFHASYPKYDKTIHSNFQSWARIQRYNFMVRIAKKYEVKTILTAHHLNDSLETAYMQLEKKIETLYLGIRKTIQYKDMTIYRPLLELTKNEILKYCEVHHIPYGVDETNFDLKYKRNYVRKILNDWTLQKLKKFEQKISKFNQEHQRLDEQVYTFYQAWKTNRDLNSLLKQDDEFIFHVLYWLFTEENISFSRNKFKMFLSFSQKNNPNKLMRVGNNKNLVIRKRHLFFV